MVQEEICLDSIVINDGLITIAPALSTRFFEEEEEEHSVRTVYLSGETGPRHGRLT